MMWLLMLSARRAFFWMKLENPFIPILTLLSVRGDGIKVISDVMDLMIYAHHTFCRKSYISSTLYLIIDLVDRKFIMNK